ncbi:hypothetical protein M3Y96_00587100 [Aphelenchoides besseyi]|nr:hypothetical protein M3Y96_00587100 [Aphelenchoides besseyi]
MGQGSSNPLPEAEAQAIEQETGFTRSQIVRLHKRFKNLDRKKRGYLEREDFLSISELNMNPLGDRIVDAFFVESVNHPDPNYRVYNAADDNRITFPQFVRVLSYFRPVDLEEPEQGSNSRINKLRFAFSMYDLNKNNYITREEFKFILNSMVGTSITAEQLDNIAERTIKEADLDNDDRISFREFCRVRFSFLLNKRSIAGDGEGEH